MSNSNLIDEALDATRPPPPGNRGPSRGRIVMSMNAAVYDRLAAVAEEHSVSRPAAIELLLNIYDRLVDEENRRGE
jgi:hypothetical protein